MPGVAPPEKECRCDGTSSSGGSAPAFLLGRGYTGHEWLPWFALYNCNARLYDPLLGRFLEPDPYVQAPDFTQGFNRFAYCLNNPLKYTDESGEFFLTWKITGKGFEFGINLGIVGIGLSYSWEDPKNHKIGVYGELGINTPKLKARIEQKIEYGLGTGYFYSTSSAEIALTYGAFTLSSSANYEVNLSNHERGTLKLSASVKIKTGIWETSASGAFSRDYDKNENKYSWSITGNLVASGEQTEHEQNTSLRIGASYKRSYSKDGSKSNFALVFSAAKADKVKTKDKKSATDWIRVIDKVSQTDLSTVEMKYYDEWTKAREEQHKKKKPHTSL